MDLKGQGWEWKDGKKVAILHPCVNPFIIFVGRKKGTTIIIIIIRIIKTFPVLVMDFGPSYGDKVNIWTIIQL